MDAHSVAATTEVWSMSVDGHSTGEQAVTHKRQTDKTAPFEFCHSSFVAPSSAQRMHTTPTSHSISDASKLLHSGV